MELRELEFKLKTHARRGGKTSRRRQVGRIRQFLVFCQGVGVKGPDQIGKRHVHLWFEEKKLSASTLRDRFYAVCFLWELLGRGKPPHPSPLTTNEAIEVVGGTKRGSSP